MMKRNFAILFLAMGALFPLPLCAQTVTETPDSLQTNEAPDRHWFSLKVLARAYGDSIVVRWAPDEYVSWKFLNAYGYEVIRIRTDAGQRIDTLATSIHPLKRKEFAERFEATDSLAGAAVQFIFGKGTKMDETEAVPGTPGSIIELKEQQETVYGLGMLVAELRPDLAQAMGLMYVDRTAQRGATYDYIIRPLIPDSVLPVRNGAVFGVRNETFVPEQYETVITDSIRPPKAVELFWPFDNHTVFDIERRDNEQGEWRVLNQRPYLPTQLNEAEYGDLNRYLDEDLDVGVYEYRIRAYDSFGQKTNPSAAIRVDLTDLVPPSIPVITLIEILRPDSAVLAQVHWRKDTLEADLAGYLPMYYHETLTMGNWIPLKDRMLAPTDTMCLINVTGLQTGHIVIAAFDKHGNKGPSVPMLLRISDVEPPATPTNLRAIASPTGRVTLRWAPSPDTDIREYSIWKANALDHVFGRISPKDLKDSIFVDSIPVRSNQKYVYYKVMAADFSGNSSELSPALAVPVPDFSQPQPCRADSIAMDDESIQIWWIGSSEASVKTHRILRQLKGDTHWQVVAIINADSLGPDHRFLMIDRPPYVQDRRYYYACETRSRMGVSSGLSLQQSFLFRGPQVINVDIKLYSSFDSKKNETRLTWNAGKLPDDTSEYYFVVYRKGPNDKNFRFITSAKRDEPVYGDALLRAGETAEYYVKIRFRDGRASTPSNTVTVTAPKKL